MDIVNLAIKVATQEVSKARGEMGELSKSLNGAESAAFKFGSVVGTAMRVTAQAVVAAVGAISTLTLAYAEHIDNLNDAAEMYGYSVTQISAMKSAAQAAGASLEDVTKATSRVKREIAMGGEAFTNLGVSMRGSNGEMKSAIELGSEVAKKYLDGSTTAAQYTDVMKVLGKDVDKAAAALKSQGEAMQLVNELQKLGIGIVQESVTATDDFSNAKLKASLVMDSAGSILVAKLLPAFTVLITKMTDSYTSGGLLKQALDWIVAAAPSVVMGIGVITVALSAIVTALRLVATTAYAGLMQLKALATLDFKGMSAAGQEWKGDVSKIMTQNDRFVLGVVNTVKSVNAELGKVKTLTIAPPTKGRNSPGGPGPIDPEKAARPPSESGIAAEFLKEEKELIRLRAEYTAMFGVREQTHVQMVQAELDSGKFAEKKDAEGKIIKKGATEAERARLLQTAADADYMKELNRVTALQLAAKKTSDDMIQGEVNRVAQNAITREMMRNFGTTQDDVNLAIADYTILTTEAQLATERAKDATSKETIALEEKLRALREMRGLQGKDVTANKEETARQETFEYGWTRAFQQYEKDAGNAAKNAESLFKNASQGMEDALVRFAETGKLSFGDLARSVIAGLIRMQAQAMVSKLFSFLTGSPGISIPSSSLPGFTMPELAPFKFATGGVFDKGTLFPMAGGRTGMLGEAGPEAIMPLSKGADGKLGIRAEGGGGSAAPNYTVIVQVEAGKDAQETGDIVSQKVLNMMKGVAQQQIAQARRVGGQLNPI